MAASKAMTKISLIGSGQIGTAIALSLAKKNMYHVSMFDVVEGMPIGKAMDVSHASSIVNSTTRVTGTSSLDDLKDSAGIIITAGVPRKPGMSRDDLLSINAKVIMKVGDAIKKNAPDAFTVVVTNPLDAMVGLLQRHTKLPANRVVGMGGVLDGGRFRAYLAEALNVGVDDIRTMVVGSHGDAMMPLTRYTSVSGIPLMEFVKSGRLPQAKLDAIIERTKHSGAEIVGHLKTGSAFNAPAVAAIEMLEAHLFDRKKVMSCSTLLTGQYGLNDIYVGTPVVIGKNGIEDTIELQLNEEEKKEFQTSVDSIKALRAALDSIESKL
eukprot:GHVU01066270.1.p1 GENE.GHVU01066270.1~~GHVU01066270.1.p1  ORF type:complete len:324 (+),score=73.99 GHVU01066270.1:118-1089(+)